MLLTRSGKRRGSQHPRVRDAVNGHGELVGIPLERHAEPGVQDWAMTVSSSQPSGAPVGTFHVDMPQTPDLSGGSRLRLVAEAPVALAI